MLNLKIMTKYLYIFILAILISSCSLESSYFGEGYELSENPEYGENIVVNRADTTFFHTWGNGRKTLQKGVLVKFHYPQNKIDSSFIWEGSIVIPSFIVEVKFDSLFVIVHQKPLDEIWGEYFTDNNNVYRRSNEPGNLTLAIKKLKESKINHYWIISKKTDDIYGPLNWNEYKHKRKELGLPKELQLKEK